MSTIKVIKDLPDTETQAMILPVIEGAYEDVKNLIPELPQEIEVHFDDWCLIPDLGTGAAAYDPNTLVLYFDKEFKGDLGAQIKDLHATVFHEAFHIAHGWTFESNTAVGDRAGTAIEQAFYEGCAIVFERDYADSKTPIGDYSKLDNVNELFREIRSLDEDYDVEAWKFWYEEKKEKWLLYRIGTWMIDEYLRKHKEKTVLDLLQLKTEDILQALAV